jgi:lysophospholipid acyltransferase 1/2
VLSAFWHGWYPGYYLSFVTGAFMTYSGRGIRRKIRPLFQANKFTIYFYDFITLIGTMLSTSFAVVPYFLLDFWSGIKFYNSGMWCVQIICVLVVIFLPASSTKKPKTKEN